MRVEKTLRRVKRRAVFFAETLREFKAFSNCFPHLLQAVSFNFQSAAFQRAVFGKRRHDKMSFGF